MTDWRTLGWGKRSHLRRMELWTSSCQGGRKKYHEPQNSVNACSASGVNLKPDPELRTRLGVSIQGPPLKVQTQAVRWISVKAPECMGKPGVMRPPQGWEWSRKQVKNPVWDSSSPVIQVSFLKRNSVYAWTSNRLISHSLDELGKGSGICGMPNKSSSL